MEKEEKQTKRIALDVQAQEHKKIKLAAANRNMTIKKYVLEAVAWRLKSDKVK